MDITKLSLESQLEIKDEISDSQMEEALRKTGENISFLISRDENKHINSKIYLIDRKPFSALLFDKLPEFLYVRAIKEDPYILLGIDNPSDEMIEAAVMKNGAMIAYIPKDRLNEKLYTIAVRNDAAAIMFIEEPSRKVREISLSSNCTTAVFLNDICENEIDLIIKSRPKLRELLIILHKIKDVSDKINYDLCVYEPQLLSRINLTEEYIKQYIDVANRNIDRLFAFSNQTDLIYKVVLENKIKEGYKYIQPEKIPTDDLRLLYEVV